MVKTSGWSLYHGFQCVSLNCREVFVLHSSYLYFHLPGFPSIKLRSLVDGKVVFPSVSCWFVALVPCVFRFPLTSGQLPQILSPSPHLLCQPQCLKPFSSISTLTPLMPPSSTLRHPQVLLLSYHSYPSARHFHSTITHTKGNLGSL